MDTYARNGWPIQMASSLSHSLRTANILHPSAETIRSLSGISATAHAKRHHLEGTQVLSIVVRGLQMAMPLQQGPPTRLYVCGTPRRSSNSICSKACTRATSTSFVGLPMDAGLPLEARIDIVASGKWRRAWCTRSFAGIQTKSKLPRLIPGVHALPPRLVTAGSSSGTCRQETLSSSFSSIHLQCGMCRSHQMGAWCCLRLETIR